MELLTQTQRQRMLANGWRNAELIVKGEEPEDFTPVVKLFCPWGSATWLLTEIDPGEPDIAFGICDLGLGFPEVGSVSLDALASITGPCGLKIERDFHFRPEKSLQAYAHEACAAGCIEA